MGNSVGNFDLVVNRDGKAYLYADASPKRVAEFELIKDYGTVAREVNSQCNGLFPPLCLKSNFFTYTVKSLYFAIKIIDIAHGLSKPYKIILLAKPLDGPQNAFTNRIPFS